jgi:methylated-DNA-[protein]-cysteine S-methyltransferase
MPVWSRLPSQIISQDKLLYRIFKIMSEIPYGTVKTYGDIGEEAGNKWYARAVGRTCSINPLVVVIPCHRVVAASNIGGYSAGLEKKRYLLSIEGVIY